MCSHVSVSVRVCSRVSLCANLVPFHRDVVKFFHIFLSRCVNFVPFHNFSAFHSDDLSNIRICLFLNAITLSTFFIFYQVGVPTLYHFKTFKRFTAMTLSILHIFRGCPRVFVCVRARACVCEFACVCMCSRVSVSIRVFSRVPVSVCVTACVRKCSRVFACVRMSSHVIACVGKFSRESECVRVSP